MEEIKKKVNWAQFISYFLIVFLSIVSILLIFQNRDLKRTLSITTSLGLGEPLKPGERVESFRVQTLDGSTTVVNYDDPTRKHLLFVLSTTCPHCERTLPAWQSIVKNKSDNCDILGVSIHNLDDTKKFLTSKDVGFYTVSVMNDTSFNRKYKISGVPETILINNNGIVEKTWVGELSDDQATEIKNLMIASGAVTN